MDSQNITSTSNEICRPSPLLLLSILTLISTSALFGFFYAYSVSAMRGLDSIDPQSAIIAMNGINSTVQNPLFAFSFFGAPLLLLLSFFVAFIGNQKGLAIIILFSLLILLLGAHAVTFAVSVPMNRELLQISDPSGLPNAAQVWDRYSGDWTFWNHIRTIASGLSVACLGYGLTTLR